MSESDQDLNASARVLATMLRAQRDALLARWTERVLNDPDVPIANRLTEPALRDHIPALLDSVITCLEEHEADETLRAEGTGAQPHELQACAHATQRFGHGYSLPEALREVSHFRLVILEACDAAGVALRGDGARLLHAAIDDALSAAALTIYEAACADVVHAEARYRRLAEANVVGIAVWNADETVLEANDAFLAMIGYTRADLEAHRVKWNPKRSAANGSDKSLRMPLATTGAAEPTQRVFFHKQGHPVPVLIAAAAIDGTDQFVALVLDESERRAAEQSLRQRAELLDLATESIVTRTLDGVIVFWNRGATAMFGWSREEAMGRNIHELLCTGFPEPLARIHEALLRDGRWEGELRRTTRDGRVLVTADRWAVQPIADGHGLYVLQTSTDVTERKRVEEDLRRAVSDRDESLALLDTFMSSAPVGMAVLDRQLQYVRVNDMLASLHGWPAADHLGRTVRDLVPHIADRAERALRSVVESGRPSLGIETDIPFPGRADDVRRLLSSYYPIRDAGGRLHAIGAIVVDITEQKRAADQIQRDAELRERFLAVLSHDLKQPLSTVLFSADALLKRHEPTPDQRRAIERIGHSSRRMNRLISDLLDVVRTRQAGGLPITPTPLDLGEVCHQVVEEVAAASPERTIDLSVSGDCNGEWDQDRLAQMLSNLVTNAVAHSPSGTPIRVEAGCMDDSDVWVTVHNGGSPIPSDLMPHLFDPFRRGARPPTGRSSAGLGLGLYIVHAIVRAHGGSIEARSDAAHGTSFTVTLPRQNVNAQRG